jgi:asparagine synthase (glutamine-hydrolysing)
MCGITGIYNFKGAAIDRDLLHEMMGQLRHRGPDGEGSYVSAGIGLGHRRLSIIDIGGGAQPITNEDGSVILIFNGEIYNYVELREELLKKGHQFKTRSDTEVITHAYEEWGSECTTRFNGIFAFALWDQNTETMLLARDHLGVKPLYYVILGDRLLFASEIKALLSDPECPRNVDLRALSLLFTLRYVPSPETLFGGIRKLPPAHTMVVRRGQLQIQRYWNRKPQIIEQPDEDSLVEQYQALVEDAVRLQMRSDVPVGLFLSSGVDSGALLSLMRQHSSHPVQTFTIGFEQGEKSNETDDARAMAKKFGAEHSEMIIGPQDYLNYYDRYIWDVEEPLGNETAVAFYFVSLIASRKVKVVLSGQGADEPWGGYHRHLGAKLSQFYSKLPLLPCKVFATFVERYVRHERVRRGAISLSERDTLSRFVKVYSFYSQEMKTKLFQPWVLEQFSADGRYGKEALNNLFEDVKDLDPLTQMLYLDTRTNLPDDLLMVGDKTAMANSLEARVPFLDYRIIEFIETLPPSMKIRWLDGKYLHKKAAAKWLPTEVLQRKKKGFANPVDKWLRGGMQHFVHEYLLHRDAGVNQFFNRSYIQKILDQHASGERWNLRHIYLLISFELWYQQFIRPTQVGDFTQQGIASVGRP